MKEWCTQCTYKYIKNGWLTLGFFWALITISHNRNLILNIICLTIDIEKGEEIN